MDRPGHPQGEAAHTRARQRGALALLEAHVDIEYDFPFAGFAEIEGIANRTDFDLKQHEEFSGRC